MRWEIREGDALTQLREMPDESVHCVVTSPPYWGLRDYGVEGQIGLEETLPDYIDAMVEVFAAVRRVLTNDGTLWLNLGDAYAGSWGAQGRTGQMAERSIVSARQIEEHPKRTGTGPAQRTPGLKPKDLIGIPWRVAFALQAEGWYLRSDIVWHKTNPMPESVQDRPTKGHEYLFLLSKSERYHYDNDAIREETVGPGSFGGFGRKADANGVRPGRAVKEVNFHPLGRNRRTVWTIPTRPFPEAHFATYPPDLVEPCILAGCPEGGTVLDPFAGAGTTGLVALRLGRSFIGIELNPEYAEMARRRIDRDCPLFNRRMAVSHSGGSV